MLNPFSQMLRPKNLKSSSVLLILSHTHRKSCWLYFKINQNPYAFLHCHCYHSALSHNISHSILTADFSTSNFAFLYSMFNMVTRVFLDPCYSMLNIMARRILFKNKADCVIPLLKTLQWLPVSLRIKAKGFSMTYVTWYVLPPP